MDCGAQSSRYFQNDTREMKAHTQPNHVAAVHLVWPIHMRVPFIAQGLSTGRDQYIIFTMLIPYIYIVMLLRCAPPSNMLIDCTRELYSARFCGNDRDTKGLRRKFIIIWIVRGGINVRLMIWYSGSEWEDANPLVGGMELLRSPWCIIKRVLWFSLVWGQTLYYIYIKWRSYIVARSDSLSTIKLKRAELMVYCQVYEEHQCADIMLGPWYIICWICRSESVDG